ncbi:Small glutamine-rich tetratricopeptide repeat-containing protein 2 [Mycoemilia scoparia]|uniref:Small glutamine-rich tetratricopeptide repeat-containing protein 2 n=1 Tax=Mycoemilia scoparia TaxID=417184 RepID=A0A9W7ZX55_9FUNG|nr:Small glutamine-rich tetratricopeptide repeat-containing protein 2 [Mycoemilia scoparia]
MVEKAIHILSTQIFGNKRFGEDERYVMRKILKRLKRSPLIFSELCYSQLSYLLRDYGTVEDIELLEVYHDGICSKIKERGLNSKKAQSVAANLLTIEIIIMYNLKGKEDYARHLLETKVKKDFPNTLKFTSREDWATFIEMILVIGDKQLCQIVNYTNLAQSPLKMFTYTVDRAIKHYMSTGDYEKVDKYLDFRFRNKCSILYNTPDIVTRRLFETKPFSEAFLATMRHGFHLHMGTDKSLPIISQIIREMDKDQMNQFFKEIFAAKDVSPEHIMQHLETVRIFSGVKNIVSEAQNYVLSIEPDLINRLNVEKFIFRVIYTKTVMVNAYRKGKFLAPRSDICKILIILLRHITAVKRQSGAGEDYSGDFYQGKVMSFGNVVDIYNPNTAENILKNNSYWYHRITISLSSKIERVLLRESLRLGANLGWEAVNSMIYHRVIHQRFEEAHRLMISVLNDIPRTSVIWIRRTSPEEAVKSMVYGLALSIYNYMGRSDMTKFITKTIFGMYPKFGLLHRFIFQGMVSIYIDSIGHDENSTVEDLKREWNWIMDYGTKISANRLNKASVPVDTKLLVLDGYIWSERRIAGLDSNNCLSYAEALVKKGAPDEALKFICQDMPQMRLKLDPKFIINMVSYFNNPKYYRHLAMVCSLGELCKAFEFGTEVEASLDLENTRLALNFDNTRKLVVSIFDFLDRSVKNNAIPIAKQCLAEGFGLDLTEDLSKYKVSSNLEDIFEQYSKNAPASSDKISEKPESSAADDKKEKEESAEAKKLQGNQELIKGNYKEAIKYYTEAIELVGTNAVYYGNRAAAYSQLGDHQNAVSDAQKSIEIDPKYAKGYSRLGHAYYGLEKFQDAIDAYMKGLELEPSNANLKSSLSAAQSKLSSSSVSADSQSRSTDSPLGGAGAGGMDFASLLNNPAIMCMASNLMKNGGLEKLMKNPALSKMAEDAQKSGKMPDMSDIMGNPEMAKMAQQFMGGNSNKEDKK